MTLFVVGTPIGNLGDVTARAADTLARVALVVAEDTRRTRQLLSHLGATKKDVVALDANASDAAVERVVARLVAGDDAALVTDAGMPGVSDPGAALVRAAESAGVTVNVVPGASALTAAVALSGLVDGPFLFVGFLPRKGGARRTWLDRIAASQEPVVLYEAPGRTASTLTDLAELAPERAAVVCRELTKLFEECARGTLGELATRTAEWRGEVTIVVAGAPRVTHAEPPPDLDERIGAADDGSLSAKDLATTLSQELGLPRRAVYQRVIAVRKASER